MSNSREEPSLIISYLNTSILKFDSTLEDPGFGADAVIIDLEDGVHSSKKKIAREMLSTVGFKKKYKNNLKLGVRINSLSSIDGIRDINSIYSLSNDDLANISFIQVPKVKSYYDIELCKSLLQERMSRLKIIPIIETPEGVENISDIAHYSDAMMFGRVDLSASLYNSNEAYMSYARGLFTATCAAHDIAAIDTASVIDKEGIYNMSDFERECILGRKEGFTSKAIIHPNQVSIVNNVFSISSSELQKNVSIINEYEKSETGFFISNGKVIAPPFVNHAKKMLKLYHYK